MQTPVIALYRSLSVLQSALTKFGCAAATAVGELVSDLQGVFTQVQAITNSIPPIAGSILGVLSYITKVPIDVLNCLIQGVSVLAASAPAIAAELCSNLGVLINSVVGTAQSALAGIFWALQSLVC